MKLMMKTVCLVLLGVIMASVANAQPKELRKLRVNVFRIDAATAAAKVQGLFAAAAAGLEVESTVTPNSTDQMRGLSQ